MPRAPPPMIENALGPGVEARVDMPLPQAMRTPAAIRPMVAAVSRAARFALGIGVVAISYASAVRITGELLSAPGLTAALFIPGALLLAALLATPALYWSAIIGATLVAHWAAYAADGTPPSAAVLSFALIALCALASAILCRRYVDLSAGFGTLRAMSRFMLIALITPLVCGVLPAAFVGLDRLPDLLAPPAASARGHRTPLIIATLGYTLAYVTVVPGALAGYAVFRNTLAHTGRLVASWPRLVEGVGLAIAVAVASSTALAAPPFPFPGALALIAPLPLVFYVVLRFRLAGAAWALLIEAVAAMHGVMISAGLPLVGSTEASIVSLQVAFLALGAPLLLLGASIDEARSARHLVDQSNERYAAAARAGRVFAASYVPATGVMEAEPQLGSLLGLEAQEITPSNWWWQRLHPDDAAPIRRWLAAQMTGRESVTAATDFRMTARDGRIRWFRLQLSPRTPATGSGVAATIVDITELKTAQLAAEQRSRELAHVARAATVGELAAALAHEIRQPLTAILINSQTAVRVLDAQPTPQQLMALR